MKVTILHILIFLSALSGMAHDHEVPAIKYQENKGQWGRDILFYGQTGAMDVYVGEGKFLLNLKNRDDLDLISDAHHGWAELPPDFAIHYHNIEFELINANFTKAKGYDQTKDYVNYFLGNDSTKWAGGVRQFGEVRMDEVYPKTDFVLSSLSNQLKYEFQLASGGDPGNIKLKINGADRIQLIDNQIHIQNSIKELVDDKPIAWQIVNGAKRFVQCFYTLSGDSVGFSVPFYDPAYPLIIDPTLIFASYTGSGSDNWGSTATYDDDGNLYGGGTVVATGGPTNLFPTVGAYQSGYQGGVGGGGSYGSDMVITKFSDDGTSLVYSTYLGGSGNEIPHSLVVNSNDQLYVLGTTSSTNYPVTTGAFDNTYAGGTATNNSNSIDYQTGSDIVITKFSANGAALIGSTYVGGSGNDGLNEDAILSFTYSDEYRGEIIVDNNDQCYVATSTRSNDFPIVNGFQSSFGGGTTDGVVFKLNSNLTGLLWSTYIGGDQSDGAYALQFDPAFNVFVTGGTRGGSFPTTAGVINPSYMGGTCDGWVAKISNNGQTLLASTYLGTSSYDQSSFVQLDLQGNVYCVGQTTGSYPIGPSWVYSVAGGGQFLHKLSNNLQATVFSTRWGTGGNNINLSLSAFLVNQCNHIFVAGWGGTVSGAQNLSTTGLPTTSNAVQTTTDGSDMYFIVFEDSAKKILFASYYGGVGTIGGEHVDGGTSRFDKKGIIYQAVCAGCGNNVFPTTTGAYSTSQTTGVNCNLGVIKYDLVTLEAEADVDGPGIVCINDSVHFLNASFGGSLFYWEFGDGATSSEFQPSHVYTTDGTYDVMLVIYDSVSCIAADTDYIEILVTPGPKAEVVPVAEICPGVPVKLKASGGIAYKWVPAEGLTDPTIADPTAVVQETTVYTVYVSDSCGVDTAKIRVKVFKNETDAITDTAVCKGLSGQLWSDGGTSYSWNPPLFLSATNVSDPLVTPDTTTFYKVTILDSHGCKRVHDVSVFVEGFVPQIWASNDTAICQGERILLAAGGSDNYQWIPDLWVLDPRLPMTAAYPEASINYIVRTYNSCGDAYDTVVVRVNPIKVEAFADTAVCLGDSVKLGASGALTYEWTGPEFSQPNKNQFAAILPDSSAWYYVRGSNINRCSRWDSLFVRVNSLPELRLSNVLDTMTGLTNVLLVADATGEVHWSSAGYVPCANCDSIVVYPQRRTVYYADVTDSNRCHVVDSVRVEPISQIFAPSSFTPNGDGINDLFVLRGYNIKSYEISIRDRWGREVFASKDMARSWNGSFFNEGETLQIGVYSYEIKYTVLPDHDLIELGTVSIVR
ncbi:MAG: gliding motility-associated C-terminal domain-containing protein [Flavobacteriales bacterium]